MKGASGLDSGSVIASVHLLGDDGEGDTPIVP
jgi:hypothetical protein